MKCSNCSNPAAYIYQPTEGQTIPYCIPCMPSFLRPQMKAGHLVKAEGFDDFLQESIAALTPEEPSLGENRALHGSTMRETAPEVEEESKPVKKAAKKASAVKPDAE